MPATARCQPCDEKGQVESRARASELKKEMEREAQEHGARLTALVRSAADSLLSRAVPTRRAARLRGKFHGSMGGNGTTTLHIDREMGQMWAIRIEDGWSTEESSSNPKWAGLSRDARLWPLEIQPGYGLPIAEKVRGAGFGRDRGILVVTHDVPLDCEKIYRPDQGREWSKLLSKFEILSRNGMPDC